MGRKPPIWNRSSSGVELSMAFQGKDRLLKRRLAEYYRGCFLEGFLHVSAIARHE